MEASVNAYAHQLNPLIDKLLNNTITLEECYALYRWIQVVYLENPNASMEEKTMATHVQSSLYGRILDQVEKEMP